MLRRRRRRMPRPARSPSLSLNRLIPNILTLLALCAGMTAIRLALAEQVSDPPPPRSSSPACSTASTAASRGCSKAPRRFGAQLDWLSDFVCFGVAPAMLLYLWTMGQLASLGWALVLLFAVCCALAAGALQHPARRRAAGLCL